MFWTPLLAQSDLEPKNEFGFNVNVLLNRMLFDGPDETEPLTLPKDQSDGLIYRRYLNSNFAYKIGFGYYEDNRRDTISSTFFFTTTSEEIKYYGFQLGIQKRLNLSKRVKPYFGLDLIYRYQIMDSEYYEVGTGNFEWEYERRIKDFNSRYGLGVPIGIQIFVSDRISISSESNLEFLYETNKNKYEEFYSQSSKSTTDTEGYRLNWKVPLAVFVNYSF